MVKADGQSGWSKRMVKAGGWPEQVAKTLFCMKYCQRRAGG